MSEFKVGDIVRITSNCALRYGYLERPNCEVVKVGLASIKVKVSSPISCADGNVINESLETFSHHFERVLIS